MSVRRIVTLWRRARRTGRDLDLVGYASLTAGALMLLASGVVGPTLDASAQQQAGAERHASR